MSQVDPTEEVDQEVEVPTAQVTEPSPTGDIELKFIDAKAYLQTASTRSGDNVYDHLAKVLTRLLCERPNDAVDIFEDVSRLKKKGKVCQSSGHAH